MAELGDLTSDFPIIPHETTGADCCGCLVVKIQGTNAVLSCNECNAVVGTLHKNILAYLVRLAPGTDIHRAACPHCGHIQAFPQFDMVTAFVCEGCGKGVNFRPV